MVKVAHANDVTYRGGESERLRDRVRGRMAVRVRKRVERDGDV